MELQFYKTSLPCLQWLTREIREREQTQELRIPDGMPDIGRVLASWGQPLIRSKEWHSGAMRVTGGILAWILYSPEGGGQPQWVDTWLPFQLKWEFPETERDGAILVQPALRSIDARSTSARKLMVRGCVSVLGEAAVPAELDVFTPQQLPGDIQVLKDTYPLLIPVEAGEKTFSIDEQLELPTTLPPISQIIRYEVLPVLTEKKVMGDKVVFRGTADLHLLYLGEDGLLHSWDMQMPFSQYAQLDRDYDENATPELSFAVSGIELEKQDDGFCWKADIISQYVIYHRPVVELVRDAYSPVRPVSPQVSLLNAISVLERRTLPVEVEQVISFDGESVVDGAFYPHHPRVYNEADGVSLELTGSIQLLGYDSAGELTAVQKQWEDTQILDADCDCKVLAAASFSGAPCCSLSAGSASLNANLPVELTTVSARGIPMVESLEVGELTAPDPDRPALILRRAGEDTLWELAKQSGSTVEAIKEANDLSREPDPDRLLLIPVS